MKFVDYPIIAVAWWQDGCPACEEFLPVWRTVAARWEPCIPSVAVNCDQYKLASAMYRIGETPTVLILRYGRPSWRRLVGAHPAPAVEAFYQAAAVGLDCQLG